MEPPRCCIHLNVLYYYCMQENLRRQQLQQQLEMKYASRENEAQLAFSTAVELQHDTAEEADALKEELEQTTLSNQSQMDALVHQVDILARLE